jgi:methanogenic corrinoid protein MtbC1
MKRSLTAVIFLHCQKAGELVEKKISSGLSVVEQFQLKLHMGMCEVCKQYEIQSNLIEHTVKRKLLAADLRVDSKEIEALKSEILQKISSN